MFTVYSSFLVLNIYFSERLSIVTGVCYTGSGLGQLIMPHLLNYLLTVFDRRGAMLIMGACMLQILLGSAVHRPETYYKKQEKVSITFKKIQENTPVIATITEDTRPHTISEREAVASIETKSNSQLPIVYSNMAYVNNDEHDHSNHQVVISCIEDNCGVTYSTEDDDKEESEEKLRHPVCNTPSFHAEKKDELSLDIHFTNSHTELTAECKTANEEGASNKVEVESAPEVIKKTTDISIPVSTGQIPKSSLVDDLLKLFKNPTFLLFIIGKVLTFAGYMIGIFFLAPFVASRGLDKDEVAMILTIVGAIDIIMRPVHGWIVSFPNIDSNVYVGCLAMIGSVIAG